MDGHKHYQVNFAQWYEKGVGIQGEKEKKCNHFFTNNKVQTIPNIQ